MTNPNGRFGIHGGQYIPETLMNAVIELEEAYNRCKNDPEFNRELTELLNEYAGRPSRLYYAEKMTRDLGGAKIYLKREDLNHTGAHKINNVLGQALLAKKMGKTRLIAETGAGQHGVATATAAALMGMECVVFMGEEDTVRQALNVYRMRLLGAEVIPVNNGHGDAEGRRFRGHAGVDEPHCRHALLPRLGDGAAPVPHHRAGFSSRHFQRDQASRCWKKRAGCRMPSSPAWAAAPTPSAAFTTLSGTKRCVSSAARRRAGGLTPLRPPPPSTPAASVFSTGMKSYFCQDAYGQIAPVYSISAGLDYPGVGPEHAYLHDTGRAEYVPVTDEEAVCAFAYLARTEGIIPAIESAHAVAYAQKLAPNMGKDKSIVITISGRGDKDCAAIARYRGEDIHE